MTKNNRLGWYELGNKRREAVTRYRDPEHMAEEEVMSDFLWWMQHDCEKNFTKERIAVYEKLIADFLGYTKKQVNEAELEMFQAWKDAVNAE